MKQLGKIFWGVLAIAVLAICYIKTSNTSEKKDAESVVGAEGKTSENKDAESVVGADGKTYYSYQSACNAGDFNAAREIIAKMEEKARNGYYSADEKEAIEEAEDYVLNEEIQYLASMNDEQANTKILLIMNKSTDKDIEVAEGACLGKNIHQGDIDGDLSKSPQEIRSFRKYISWCANYNAKCNTVLRIAIATGNQSLSKKILHLFKNDPEIVLKNKRTDKDPDFIYPFWDVYAHYTNGSRIAAKKKYDEAVKAGAFN